MSLVQDILFTISHLSALHITPHRAVTFAMPPIPDGVAKASSILIPGMTILIPFSQMARK
jgi:hypothetical protein